MVTLTSTCSRGEWREVPNSFKSLKYIHDQSKLLFVLGHVRAQMIGGLKGLKGLNRLEGLQETKVFKRLIRQ